MARSKWKGSIKIGLVMVPVKMYGAIDSAAAISFNQLHTCGSRIKQKKWCPECDAEVPTSDIQKGFEHAKDKYVVVSSEELESVQVEATHTIDVQVVCAASEIDEVRISGHDYLAPDGPIAAPAYAVIHQALGKRVAVGTLVQHGKEAVVAIRVKGAGLLLQSLHYPEAVRPIENVDGLQSLPAVKKDERKLADQLLGSLEGSFADVEFPNAYDAALKGMLVDKVAGNVVSIASKKKEPKALSDLRAALTASLKVSPKKKVRRKRKVS